MLGKPFYDAIKTLSFTHIYRQIKHWSKERQLKAFLDFYYYLDPQGSAGWRQGRIGIGGSEMSVITEENDNKDFRGLIGEKIALPEFAFSGSIATRWGNIFEPVLGQYISYYLNSEIHETGSIPGLIRRSNGDPIQRYSPDGLAFVQKTDYAKIINETSRKYFDVDASQDKEFKKLPDDLILLFEFKNPFMRLPKGIVKKDYLAQPKTGMCTIPIVDATLFVDGVIRKCAIENFNLGPSYDWKLNPKSRKLNYDKCIACGFIGIMDTGSPYEVPSAPKNNEWDISDDEDPHGSVKFNVENEENIEYDEPNDSDITPTQRKEIINAMIRQIARYAIRETHYIKSELHNIIFNLENLASIVRLIMNLFHVIANDSFADVVFTYNDEIRIINGCVARLFNYQALKVGNNKSKEEDCKQSRIDAEIAIRLIPNIVDQLSYEEPSYNVNDLPFGLDYGSSAVTYGVPPDDFEAFAERVVNDRHIAGGIKLYYPNCFFFDYEREDSNRFLHYNNYIDCSKERNISAKKWLFTNVEEFIEHCQKTNVRPMGILPWKLFEACAMPMYKEPGFVWKHEDKIRETIAIVDEIMSVEDVDQRRGILDSYYAPKPKRSVSRRIRTSPTNEPVNVTQFDNDTTNFFSNMDIGDD
jgi:hypothetical protein